MLNWFLRTSLIFDSRCSTNTLKQLADVSFSDYFLNYFLIFSLLRLFSYILRALRLNYSRKKHFWSFNIFKNAAKQSYTAIFIQCKPKLFVFFRQISWPQRACPFGGGATAQSFLVFWVDSERKVAQGFGKDILHEYEAENAAEIRSRNVKSRRRYQMVQTATCPTFCTRAGFPQR